MTRTIYRALVALTAMLVFITTPAAAQKVDPLSGTWVLNVAESDMEGPSASASETIVFVVTDGWESFTANAVAANNGERENTIYRARYGGEPVTMHSVYYAKDGSERMTQTQVQVRRVGDRVRERVLIRDGKVTMRARREISEDGMKMRAGVYGTNDKGEEVLFQTRVFDKQY